MSGYNQIYKGGAIREAACLAHLRRKIFDVHDSQPTELSTTAMAGIQAIYRIEEEIRGLPPAERLAARRRRTRPLVRALRRQLMRQGKGLSRHADIAKAFAYGTKRWRAFNRFLYDGQLEPDNLIAERAIRGFTISQTFCPCRARGCRLVSMAPVFRADRSMRVYRGAGERQSRAHCRAPWRSHCRSRMDVGSRRLRSV
nr:transposase [Mesorhizobium sp.]